MIEFWRFMKIIHIVGARPQFIKAAMVSRAWKSLKDEYLLHTGQHYDADMSKLFFDELNLKKPNLNLGVGSENHANQTSKMLVGIDSYLERIQADHVIIYGDTNSTLAGALAASKREIPISHVEAGLRSFNRSMPEEINRVVSDHISNLLFCPTEKAAQNLIKEGIKNGVHLVGDVMADALYFFRDAADKQSDILEKLEISKGKYVLATIHRSGNVDHKRKLTQIFEGLGDVNRTIILPLHPRTKKMIRKFNLSLPENIRLIKPVGYLDMIMLEQYADCIFTDSGGIQKEAYLLGIRCITLREETEWVETVEAGWNVLAGSSKDKISSSFYDFQPDGEKPYFYGDGDAADKIVQVIKSF